MNEKKLRKLKIKDNYLVEGMVGNGEVTILSAKPKVGKSTFAYDLARHVARGQEFLGHQAQKADVIYYAIDANDKDMAYIAQLHQDEPIDNLEVITLSELQIDIKKGQSLSLDQLEKNIIKYRAKYKNKKLLVIIDVLININHKTYNGQPLLTNGIKSYEDMMALLQIYKCIADEYNMAFILVHHNNKNDNPSGDPFDNITGSTGIQGGLQNMLVLERINDDVKSQVRRLNIRARKLADDELTIERQSDGTYIPTEDITIQEQTEDTDLVRLINYVSLEGHIEGTANEICSKIKFKTWLAGGLIKQLHKNEELLKQSSIEFHIKKVHGNNYITLICTNLSDQNQAEIVENKEKIDKLISKLAEKLS